MEIGGNLQPPLLLPARPSHIPQWYREGVRCRDWRCIGSHTSRFSVRTVQGRWNPATPPSLPPPRTLSLGCPRFIVTPSTPDPGQEESMRVRERMQTVGGKNCSKRRRSSAPLRSRNGCLIGRGDIRGLAPTLPFLLTLSASHMSRIERRETREIEPARLPRTRASVKQGCERPRKKNGEVLTCNGAVSLPAIIGLRCERTTQGQQPCRPTPLTGTVNVTDY